MSWVLRCFTVLLFDCPPCDLLLLSGTIERLSGHFKDQMRIAHSMKADDGSGDMLVVVVNEPRCVGCSYGLLCSGCV